MKTKLTRTIVMAGVVAATTAVMMVFTTCNPNPPQQEGKQSKEITLTVLDVQPDGITCSVEVNSQKLVLIRGIRYQANGEDRAKEVFLEDGETVYVFSNLYKQTTYTLTPFALLHGDEDYIYGAPQEVTTHDPVEIRCTDYTESTIDLEISINTPRTVLMYGFTWREKTTKEKDANTVYLENNEKQYTLTELKKNITYVLKALALVDDGGSQEFLYSDEIEVFTGDIKLIGDYQLVFQQEFNEDNQDLTKIWSFEEGEKIRNNEAQFYSKSKENAYTKGGYLHIIAFKDHLGSDGKTHNYTSASMTTSKRFVYCYGRVEVRAKIPTGGGMWPAIWQVGNKYSWPQNGELDIMEYYKEAIKGNFAWGSTTAWQPVWKSSSTPMSHFEMQNPNWRNEFHTWVLEWDDTELKILLDDEQLNSVKTSDTYNHGLQGNYENPYLYHTDGFGHYLWLNLALGGNCGGTIDNSLFPAEYLIDYVRVYQKTRLPENGAIILEQ